MLADDAPTNLCASENGNSQIDLQWSAPKNSHHIIGYRIDRESPDRIGFYTIISNTGNTNTTYPDVGLLPGVKYFYRVYAVKANNTSPPSNTAEATTEY